MPFHIDEITGKDSKGQVGLREACTLRRGPANIFNALATPRDDPFNMEFEESISFSSGSKSNQISDIQNGGFLRVQNLRFGPVWS